MRSRRRGRGNVTAAVLADLCLRENALGAERAFALDARVGSCGRGGCTFSRRAQTFRRGDRPLHLSPELERLGDLVELFLGPTRPGDDDRAIAQHPADEILI